MHHPKRPRNKNNRVIQIRKPEGVTQQAPSRDETTNNKQVEPYLVMLWTGLNQLHNNHTLENGSWFTTATTTTTTTTTTWKPNGSALLSEEDGCFLSILFQAISIPQKTRKSARIESNQQYTRSSQWKAPIERACREHCASGLKVWYREQEVDKRPKKVHNNDRNTGIQKSWWRCDGWKSTWTRTNNKTAASKRFLQGPGTSPFNKHHVNVEKWKQTLRDSSKTRRT